MVIFITIMVRNFILLARRKIYVTPESILNGVQYIYSATQTIYNATSGHAAIYVRPLRWSFGNFHGCSRGNIIWLGVQINPLSVVLLSDHSMASSRIIVMKNKIDRITIPQKLGKQSTSSKWHTLTLTLSTNLRAFSQMHVFLFQEYLRFLKMSL